MLAVLNQNVFTVAVQSVAFVMKSIRVSVHLQAILRQTLLCRRIDGNVREIKLLEKREKMK